MVENGGLGVWLARDWALDPFGSRLLFSYDVDQEIVFRTCGERRLYFSEALRSLDVSFSMKLVAHRLRRLRFFAGLCEVLRSVSHLNAIKAMR